MTIGEKERGFAECAAFLTTMVIVYWRNARGSSNIERVQDVTESAWSEDILVPLVSAFRSSER